MALAAFLLAAMLVLIGLAARWLGRKLEVDSVVLFFILLGLVATLMAFGAFVDSMLRLG